MFKAVIEVKHTEDSAMKFECVEKSSYDEATKDLDISKKIWEDAFVSGRVVEC